MSTKLRALVVGVNGMGANHARIVAQHPEYELAGICDLNAEVAHKVADPLAVPVWSDLLTAIRESGAEVVSVCTPNASHASLTMAAARAGVRAVNCEKPMAVNLADARHMTEVCTELGVALIVNHQRRLAPDLLKAREMIVAGAIGDLVSVEGYCAGDFLSDGTHLVDSLAWLTGDARPVSITATLDFHPESEATPYGLSVRYGHPVEKGLAATVTLESGVELRFTTGSRAKGRVYQDYVVNGTAGRLWRVGDRLQPNLFVERTGEPGDLVEAYDPKQGFSRPVAPADVSTAGATWKPVELPPPNPLGNIAESYHLLHAWLAGTGTPHPLRAEIALRNFEVVMAAYEAGRLGQTLQFPLQQERYPLEIIREERAASVVIP